MGGGGGGGVASGGVGHVDTLKCSYTYISAQCRQTMVLCANELDMFTGACPSVMV